MSAQSTDKGTHWSYEGATGPEHWAELDSAYALCGSGKRQSPIDLVDAEAAELEPLSFTYRPFTLCIIDNGHSIQVDVEAGGDLIVGGKHFALQQFHFHAPAEHTIAGEQSTMEAHLVHRADDGEIAVVAVLMETGQPNSVLDLLWKNLPGRQGIRYTYEGIQVDARGFLPGDAAHFTYLGSLTTPPGAEGVRWIVFEQLVSLSTAQLKTFTRRYLGTNRPVQPRNGRVILKGG